MSDEDAVEFDPAKAKEKRAQDAEKIRQDFVKSQQIPAPPSVTKKPLTESTEDEY